MPRASLDTFAWEFRQGMAARAKALGDVGDSSPEHWEAPLGSPGVHVVLTAVAPDPVHLEATVDRARPAYDGLSGVTAIWRQDCYALPAETEHSVIATWSAIRPSKAVAYRDPTSWKCR
ncbi:hypothetical protein [Streptomyces sp. NPDC047453]|uniref:hypothetical protein n=1 Tax=Streptomyces sp. NPDC047453 TaxID=3154812 RepID=UPI0033C6D4F2